MGSACEEVPHSFRDPITRLVHHCSMYCHWDYPLESPVDCQELCPDYRQCSVKAYFLRLRTSSTTGPSSATTTVGITPSLVPTAYSLDVSSIAPPLSPGVTTGAIPPWLLGVFAATVTCLILMILIICVCVIKRRRKNQNLPKAGGRKNEDVVVNMLPSIPQCSADVNISGVPQASLNSYDVSLRSDDAIEGPSCKFRLDSAPLDSGYSSIQCTNAEQK